MKHRLLGALALSIGLAVTPAKAATEILNASYDIARELFAEINPKFQSYWKAETGEDVTIRQSHAGTSRQARAIIEGLQADVVTFNQYTDIEMLAKNGLIAADWKSRLPHDSSPYYSAPAFLVRKGNPKNIRDWGDLAAEGVKVVFPNPKTSGNARYTYLGAWTWALKQFDGDEEKIKDFMVRFLANVPVFDTGGRGATTTFVERKIGDVLITFEAETHNIRKEYGDQAFEVVVPSTTVVADFPVSVVDRVADRRGSRKVAEAYLNYLYSDEAQELLAQRYYRVRSPAIAEKYADQFPPTELIKVEEVIGDWDKIQELHFASDAMFDQLMRRTRR
ncbi:MAG: thiosulfate ABC transporter substrate-binding protein CysP [Xanthomonadaceae bacterium]|nr:thiosulfate ABC transporter substrate-binding protein CysP [Xanthomonadaceae bacterium]